MQPVLVQIGPVVLYAYSVLGAVGLIVTAAIAIYRASVLGIQGWRVLEALWVGVMVGLLGARALFVVEFPDQIQGWQDVVDLRGGGYSSFGASLGFVAAGAVLSVRQQPVYAVADAFAIALPIGHAISRVGCFLAGCCWGLSSDLPWAVALPHLGDEAVHPTQLYEAAGLMGIAVFGLWLSSRRRFDGQGMLTYLVLYAALRSGLELLRGDPKSDFFPWIFGDLMTSTWGWSAATVVSAVAIFGVLPWMRYGPRVSAPIQGGRRQAEDPLR